MRSQQERHVVVACGVCHMKPDNDRIQEKRFAMRRPQIRAGMKRQFVFAGRQMFAGSSGASVRPSALVVVDAISDRFRLMQFHRDPRRRLAARDIEHVSRDARHAYLRSVKPMTP